MDMTPSYDVKRHMLIQVFANLGAVRTGEFTLASGAKSDFYVDAKAVLSHGTGLSLAARCLVEEIVGLGLVSVVAGMAEGANNLLGGLLAEFTGYGRGDMQSVLIRPQAKAHGTGGEFITGLRFDRRLPAVVVEDVTTTGMTALRVATLLREKGLKVLGVVTLVDRDEGAAAALDLHDLRLRAVLRRGDLLAGGGE